MTSAMLETKFHIARPRPGAVPRARLVDVLDRGVGGRLTLVSAPAGFGKTSLLAQWLGNGSDHSRGGRLVAWLSLDASDSEPGRYLSYVFSALRLVAP